jgi:glucose/mannose-6-phosphate isomerase
MAAAKSREPQGIDLDNEASYRYLDPEGMMGFAKNFSGQVGKAARIGCDLKLGKKLRNPAQVVLAGMGGSAVAGDFLARCMEGRAPVPFLVCRHYRVPAFVGRETLFLASSHSGNTEETLSASDEACERGARVVCISTGGKLKAFAEAKGLPWLRIPRTRPKMPPRSALGFSLIPLVSLLGSIGLWPGAVEEIAESLALLKELRAEVGPEVAQRTNRAKQLARKLFGKMPWVQGTAGIMSAAAYRWRCQFNENSKVLAYSSEYPEMNHNEVVGWELPRRQARKVEVVILRGPNDHCRVAARVDITKKLIAPKARVHVVEGKGESPLAQLLWTVYLGDFTSLYLAFLNGVNPASIDAINFLKGELAALPRCCTG